MTKRQKTRSEKHNRQNQETKYTKIKSQKEKLEFELYRSLPELKSKIYNLEDISKELVEDSVLIVYQKQFKI